jgi:hypothetical protein
MFHLARRISGGVLWANLALLFSLSLLPFTTEWMADSRLARTPLFVYGLNLTFSAVAYFVLQTLLIRQEGADSPLKRAIGRDVKGKISPVLYVAGMLSTVLVDPHGRLGVWVALPATGRWRSCGSCPTAASIGSSARSACPTIRRPRRPANRPGAHRRGIDSWLVRPRRGTAGRRRPAGTAVIRDRSGPTEHRRPRRPCLRTVRLGRPSRHGVGRRGLSFPAIMPFLMVGATPLIVRCCRRQRMRDRGSPVASANSR